MEQGKLQVFNCKFIKLGGLELDGKGVGLGTRLLRNHPIHNSLREKSYQFTTTLDMTYLVFLGLDRDG